MRTLAAPKSDRLLLRAPYTRDAWLELRRLGIGASDIAAVAGFSRYRSPWDVWSSKVDGTEWEGTDDSRWGSYIEGQIVGWWAGKTEQLIAEGGLYQHPDMPWILASPDAVEIDGPTTRQPVAVVDAKNAGWYMANEWADDEAPIEYVAQITWQMLAVGVQVGYLVASIGGRAPTARRFDFDPELADGLVKRAGEFWEQVKAGTPPPIDGSGPATKWIAHRYPDADPDMVRTLDRVDVEALRDVVALGRRIDELTEQRKARENLVKSRLGDAEFGMYEGREFVRWSTVHRAGYEVKPTTYRKFTIPKRIAQELSDGNH